MDEYDAASEKIRITGVISQGVYRHVINILKLLADTFQQGLMELPGLEKEVLVNAAIFHDLGKVQPDLKVGDLVRPEEVFEPGYLHAARGAALARGIYNLNPNTVVLIEYHHHAEEGLPGDFPAYLLPMYRFFRLIDGLSAGITRRKAEVKLRVDGSKIHVVENSPMPRYNRSFVLDLYSGSVT
ncbi:MAG: HD domain-containing protein [Firmicutes bacterium]|nr:HD domain-containing protein [Bacillota bacterium]